MVEVRLSHTLTSLEKHLSFFEASFLSTRVWRFGFHLQFCRDEQNQGHGCGPGELAQLAHHAEAQVEESCAAKGVGQTVQELSQ